MEEVKSSKLYSIKRRVIIRSLLAVFTVMAVVFGILAAYILAMVGPEEIFNQGSIESSVRYQDIVSMEIQGLQNNLDSRRPFEENGELKMDKTIDIMNPYEADKSKQNKNTTFTVEELTTMNRNDVFGGVEEIGYDMGLDFGSSYTLVEGVYDNYGVAEDYEDTFIYEVGYEIESKEEPYSLDSKQREAVLIERLGSLRLETPISGIPLMEYVEDNKEEVTAVKVWYALKDMREMMYAYDDAASWSWAGDTNFRYFIKDNETNQIVTNGGWKSIDEARKAAEETGILIDYKRDAKGCEIAANSTKGFEYAKQAVKQLPLVSQDEEAIITVDDGYLVQDQLAEYNYAYTSLKPQFKPFLGWAILSLIGAIICFILATITTGQSEKHGEVHLNFFDKIPTEIAAAIVCLMGIIDLATCSWVYDGFGYRYVSAIINLLCVIGFAGTGMLIATWGYLSLVRRIKAKDLWKNSLLCRIVETIKKIYGMGKVSTRLVIAFIAFVLAQILLVVILQIPGLIMLAIIDTAVLIYLLKETQQRQKVKDGLDTIASGNLDYKLDTNDLKQDNKEMAEAANKIGDGLQNAIEKSMKDERMRSELITNVSHDIKTPLTSIINYVDLLKRENIQNPQAKGYIDILDAKSQRLKHLTEDLVEASKVSSGNVELHMNNLFVQELLQQAAGEFAEKLKARKLELVSTLAAEPVIIKADGRQMWRIFENLLNNIAKYALEGTRVYVDLTKEEKKATLMFKNVSQDALNISADELTERFVRGDISRTTEGSGLGLSIAKNLTELQGGKFDIYLDGDLFKVTIAFDTV